MMSILLRPVNTDAFLIQMFQIAAASTRYKAHAAATATQFQNRCTVQLPLASVPAHFMTRHRGHRVAPVTPRQVTTISHAVLAAITWIALWRWEGWD